MLFGFKKIMNGIMSNVQNVIVENIDDGRANHMANKNNVVACPPGSGHICIG